MMKNEEEFVNFMHRVNEVHGIVKKLSSTDKTQIDMGIQDADRYLGDTAERTIENIDEQNIELKVTTNKTIINPVKEEKPRKEGEMDPDVFMKEIEKDCAKRTADKKIRTERADTFKVQGNKAFKRKEYEKAVVCYSKAIEQIKDSGILYLNRALSYIELELYDKAEVDCDWALRLNESSLKGLTYLAKIYYEKNDLEKSREYLQKALEHHSDCKEIIHCFVHNFGMKELENDFQ